MAFASSTRVRQRCRSRSSICIRLQNDSRSGGFSRVCRVGEILFWGRGRALVLWSVRTQASSMKSMLFTEGDEPANGLTS